MELIWHLYMDQLTRVIFPRYIRLQPVNSWLVCLLLLLQFVISTDFVACGWCIWSEVIGGSLDVSCDRFHSDEGIAIRPHGVSLPWRTFFVVLLFHLYGISMCSVPCLVNDIIPNSFSCQFNFTGRAVLRDRYPVEVHSIRVYQSAWTCVLVWRSLWREVSSHNSLYVLSCTCD